VPYRLFHVARTTGVSDADNASEGNALRSVVDGDVSDVDDVSNAGDASVGNALRSVVDGGASDASDVSVGDGLQTVPDK